MSSTNLVPDVFAQTIGNEKRYKKGREDKHLEKQLLQFDVEQMGAQVIKVLAGKHGENRKDHRPLQDPQRSQERLLADMKEISPRQRTQRKSDKQQVEKQGWHDEKGQQPEQDNGEQHGGERQQKQHQRKFPGAQPFSSCILSR
jgi:hypothetical protein